MNTNSRTNRLPKYKRAPERFGPIEPTDRDLEILGLVHDYRYLTAEMIMALIPGSKRQIARRLQGLFHHAFLARLLPPLRATVADGLASGSPRISYALDKQGARAISHAEGLDPASFRWTPDSLDRMHWFLQHALMVSAFRATLALALAPEPDGLQLLQWLGEDDLRDAVLVKYPDGTISEHRVAPDGYFAVRERAESRNFFLEMDRGTEEHPRLLRKFQAYWWYLADGSPYHRKFENAKNRLVLVVTSSEKRMEGMRRTLRRVDPKGRGLRQFWFTTESSYKLSNPASLLGPIWHAGPARTDGSADAPRRLFENDEAPR